MKFIKILSLICFLTIGIFAQADYYALEGTVTDAQGSVIVGAEVTLTSETDTEYSPQLRPITEVFFDFNNIPWRYYVFLELIFYERAT